MITVLWSLLRANWKPLAVIVVSLAVIGWFSHVRYEAGEAHVQGLWDEDKAAAAKALADATARAEATAEADRQHAQEIENGLVQKLAAATANGSDLADRLRKYAARRCPAVPAPAGAPGEPDAAPGEPADGRSVDAALTAHLAACARDAERLQAWHQWYGGLIQR